jgi:hypothetical protein
VWRVVHAVFALGLGLYIALGSTFGGTKIERERIATAYTADDSSRNFFMIFASVEAVLLTTRFFIDKSQAQPTGILGMVAGFLPAPYKGYLSVALRYGQIFLTVRADLLILVFVLGACSWLRSF